MKNKRVYILEKTISLECSIKSKFGNIVGTLGSIKAFKKIKQSDYNSFLIIPNNNRYTKKILSYGFIEFKDFVVEKYAFKKLVGFYGNCHTKPVIDALNSNEMFNSEYVIYPLKEIYQIKDTNYFNNPVFENLDLFIHQSIRKENIYGEKYSSDNVLMSLNSRVKVISMPNLYKLPLFLFPQYIPGNELRKRFRNQTVFFRDKIIENSLINKLKFKEIVSEYRNKDYFNQMDQKKQEMIFFEKVKEREKDWDIKVSEYIKDNYQNIHLFNDPNHPSDNFFKYIASSIVEKLFMGKTISFNESDNISRLDPYEIPICESTLKNLNINYRKTEIRISGQKVRYKKMDLDEYILQYISMKWYDKTSSRLLKFKSFMLWLYLKLLNIPKLFYKLLKYLLKKFRI